MPNKPILMTSNTSPFGRITRIARIELELNDKIDLSMADAETTKIEVSKINPLVKMPVLLHPDGSFLVDSRTILEYFKSLVTTSTLYPNEAAHYELLTRLSLAHGILDAALLLLYERKFYNVGHRSESWQAHQITKICNTIRFLSQLPSGRQADIGDIAFAVCLDFLDFRFEAQFTNEYESLEEWRMQMQLLFPSLLNTRPIE